MCNQRVNSTIISILLPQETKNMKSRTSFSAFNFSQWFTVKIASRVKVTTVQK